MKFILSAWGVVLIVFLLIGAYLWPYSINSWLSFFGKEAIVTWWQGALLGVCPGIGQVSIPVAFFTWVLMLFLG